MAVWVFDVHLQRAVGPRAPRQIRHANPLEVLFPGRQIIDAQSEVVAAVSRKHWLGAVSDQVEFLNRSQPEPRAGEGEGRTGNRLQHQHAPVKFTAFLDVLHVNRDVVQFVVFHGRNFGSVRFGKV